MNIRSDFFVNSDSHKDTLGKRKQKGNFRTLNPFRREIDFCSNDYLGLARSAEFRKKTEEIIDSYGDYRNGSGGSRLICGTTMHLTELEKTVADFHNTESALIFNSGYSANIGLFSCIGRRQDTIIVDEKIHASVHDGLRLSLSRNFKFSHNNIEDLERKIKNASGDVYVAVEALYSMDGDLAPLADIAAICKKYKARLIVDEAHSTGIFGDRGEGLATEVQIDPYIFAKIHTYGKAMGCHGASVCGGELLINYLVNYSRPFIFTTAVTDHIVASIQAAYSLMPELSSERSRLQANIDAYRKNVNIHQYSSLSDCRSPVQIFPVDGNEHADICSKELEENGFAVKPVKSPTVSEGKERLRICIHEFNIEKEINDLATLLNNIKKIRN
ncbi:MAG: pyridoxal phosphate-dependent aminotransferase family protein [Bacteroidetes bacterium]|nr:MAG: pyridoxal phosphate-dependent aminotransferase family protein [Bacteroidota bacterium]REJ99846.1 MAG: pyridoxal phosphate-dependent aminotransferase family protein [Bacteroidota bacterium]REK34219.1 MAG: pyridoxal phosphate-dependent aminotransferase family protein [Bacteroidota bacterium]REK50549.1 MAG: pyridoxal phosphate-dependent aminotransferase family protein [Bacteroidota bacterium]